MRLRKTGIRLLDRASKKVIEQINDEAESRREWMLDRFEFVPPETRARWQAPC